ncbi:MAG: DUF1036 domain-containing protein [Pseudomonadota bacterium]
MTQSDIANLTLKAGRGNQTLNRFRALFALILTASLWVLPSAPAVADFRVCNDTGSLVGVSVGYRVKAGWITEGWWRIPANSCASLIEGQLSSRFYYVYAEDADLGGQWRGDIVMCTSDKEFKITGRKDCYARGYEKTGFFEVDTGEQNNWLLRLSESGQSGAEPNK